MFQNSNLDENLVNELTNDSKDDAYIICAYTCESKKSQYSPYRLLNQNLMSDNRQKSIKNISKYLYIIFKIIKEINKILSNKDK